MWHNLWMLKIQSSPTFPELYIPESHYWDCSLGVRRETRCSTKYQSQAQGEEKALKGEAELSPAPPLLPDCPIARPWAKWPPSFATAVPASGSGKSGRKQSALTIPPPGRPIQLLSFQSVPTADPSVAPARGSHAITRAGRFRCAARAAGTGLPGDPWCAVAAATSAPVPRRFASLLLSSGFPGPDPRGPWQASVEPVREPAGPLHSPFTTPRRDSDREREGLWRLRAVCRRAGPRGRGSSSPRDACASSRLHFLFTAVTLGAASRLQPGARVHRSAPLSSPGAAYPRECEPRGSQAPPGKSPPSRLTPPRRGALAPECGVLLRLPLQLVFAPRHAESHSL